MENLQKASRAPGCRPDLVLLNVSTTLVWRFPEKQQKHCREGRQPFSVTTCSFHRCLFLSQTVKAGYSLSVVQTRGTPTHSPHRHQPRTKSLGSWKGLLANRCETSAPVRPSVWAKLLLAASTRLYRKPTLTGRRLIALLNFGLSCAPLWGTSLYVAALFSFHEMTI